ARPRSTIFATVFGKHDDGACEQGARVRKTSKQLRDLPEAKSRPVGHAEARQRDLKRLMQVGNEFEERRNLWARCVERLEWCVRRSKNSGAEGAPDVRSIDHRQRRRSPFDPRDEAPA